jgi:tight adherence protein B
VSGIAWLLAALLLAGAAVVAAWPARRVMGRLHRRRFSLPTVDPARLRGLLRAVAERRPKRAWGALVALAALIGAMAGGPVAALLAVAYGALSARSAGRRSARRRAAASRARSLDDLSALAADLRAGLTIAPAGAATIAVGGAGSDPAGSAAGGVGVAPPDGRIGELTSAVWRLAERTGAPAADLVERLEADARAADRSRAGADAQAAGARSTALLLAVLPVGGIALGYGIGTDPLRVLLHTPIGAACAIGAALLQCAGLVWTDRLVNGPAR